jgi:hypothetical protein
MSEWPSLAVRGLYKGKYIYIIKLNLLSFNYNFSLILL